MKGLSNRAQSKLEVNNAPTISNPPMVGVPALAKWPSGPSSRMGWPLPWRLRNTLIKGRPKIKPKKSAVKKAQPARTVI